MKTPQKREKDYKNNMRERTENDNNNDDVIDDGSDKTTVHDKALMGCLADGCHHHGAGYLPLVKLGTVPSNTQLC